MELSRNNIINSEETLNSFGIIPLIAVSACLMGDKVRFDGGHKLHKFVSDNIVVRETLKDMVFNNENMIYLGIVMILISFLLYMINL